MLKFQSILTKHPTKYAKYSEKIKLNTETELHTCYTFVIYFLWLNVQVAQQQSCATCAGQFDTGMHVNVYIVYIQFGDHYLVLRGFYS